MLRPRTIALAKIAILLSVPLILFAYAEGPDAGAAGVTGESGCTACHRSGSGGGSVSVTFPGGLTYTPGVKQHLVVTVTDTAQRRWGFQLTARQSNSNSTQAGTFTPGTDGYTQIVCTQTTFQSENFGSCPDTMPLQYIEQTKSGTRKDTRGPVTFAFDWTPPASNVGSINIFAAGNAADGDGTEKGDHIYTQKYTLAYTAPPATIDSVTSAAGGQAAIAANSWVTIKGTNLSSTTRSWTAADITGGKLPSQLDNVGVTINGKAAVISYISPTQINALAPTDTSTGPVSVLVTNSTGSATATAQLQSFSPACFLWSSQYAVATRADYTLAGPASLFPGQSTPAKPGETIILWTTGLGTVTPAIPDATAPPASPISTVDNTVTVLIGGVAATVYGAALSPGNAGLYQVAVQVPPALSDGDQAVSLTAGGVSSPTGALLTVKQ
jgi:uncharacterized protein (TIGR03437 family)